MLPPPHELNPSIIWFARRDESCFQIAFSYLLGSVAHINIEKKITQGRNSQNRTCTGLRTKCRPFPFLGGGMSVQVHGSTWACTCAYTCRGQSKTCVFCCGSPPHFLETGPSLNQKLTALAGQWAPGIHVHTHTHTRRDTHTQTHTQEVGEGEREHNLDYRHLQPCIFTWVLETDSNPGPLSTEPSPQSSESFSLRIQICNIKNVYKICERLFVLRQW